MSARPGRNLRDHGLWSNRSPSISPRPRRNLRDHGRQGDRDPSDCVRPFAAQTSRDGAVA